MSDLREAIAKALYDHQFRADDPVDPIRWAKFRDEYLNQADVVLGVVHEHVDIEAAAKRRYEDVRRRAEHKGFTGWIDWNDLEDDERQEEWVDEMRPYIIAALGGSEKP